MKKFCFLAAGFAVLLVGCGGGSNPEAGAFARDLARTMGVTLDGRVGPANAGIRLAEEGGYFEAPGVDIWSGSPVEPAKPVSYVALGSNEFGVTQLPQLVLARDKGMPLVAIGSLVPQPTAAMIWLKGSEIHGISDLKGRTIAIPGVAFQEALLGSILARAGLTLEDVKVKRVGYGLVSALLDGRADAIFGGSRNVEGAALEAQGAEPVIKRVQDLGVPAYDELVVIARRDSVAEEPQLIRDFMSAVSRGVAAELQDPEAAVKLIEESSESSPESSRKETRAGVEATNPLLSRTGGMDPDRVRGLVDWMYEKGLIERKWPASALIATTGETR